MSIVLLEFAASIPDPKRPPTNVGLMRLGLFNRSYSFLFLNISKPLFFKLFLSSMATKSYPYEGREV